jgi:DNA-binding SARP family transcriptional activator/tetratricopeptide (TPR) repeat protein
VLIEFRLLGPVEMWVHGSQIDLGPSKNRLMIAALLMEAGGTLPFDVLVQRVWDEDPPAKVAISVQASMSRLRRRLELTGDERIRLDHVSPIGYRLIVPAQSVDALEFSRVVIQGQAAARAGDAERAISLLEGAHEMVRGEPLAGLPGAWVLATRAGLMERRHAAALTRIRLQLEHHDPRGLVAELKELAGQHPLDESVAALLMRALHGAGRTADALSVYDRLRRQLRTQLGIDPHRALNEVHQMVLRGEPAVAARPRSSGSVAEQREMPNTLERDPPNFVGRQADVHSLLSRIRALLERGGPAVCVIDGMPGVGKSALALRLAHRLRVDGFDGALQLDLRGHDPLQSPTTPPGALGLLLGMLSIDMRELQKEAGLDHAISLWRRYTGTRRLVIVLDDAVDEQQIRPLMPSGPGTVVLITSRHRLAGLPEAVHHSLSPMHDGDAQKLFTQVAGITDRCDSGDVRRIVEACGRLPLALSVAGGFLRARPSWSLTDFADHLTRTLSSTGDDGFTKRLNTTFETSYRSIPELSRRVLRYLALHPNSGIGLHAAAALVGAAPRDTDSALDLLVEHSLLDEPQRHRYRMHDLVRGFASHVLARDDRPEQVAAAEDRLVGFTLASVERATALFHPYRHVNLMGEESPVPTVEVLSFPNPQHAAAWLDLEQSALRAQAMRWHSKGRAREAAALSHMLGMYFDRRGLWREAEILYETARRTWARLGDKKGEAYALGDLATVDWRLGAFEKACAHSETALELWRGLGDLGGRADALLCLGRAHHYAHRHEEAIRCYGESVSLRSDIGDKVGMAEALYHLGIVSFAAGRHEKGIADTLEALDLSRMGNNMIIERNCMNNLGEFYRQRGEYDQALACYREAVALAELVGDPRNIAVAALNLGEMNTLLQRPEEALACLQPALEIFTRLATRDSTAHVFLAQARAFEQLALREEAETALSKAADIAEQLADPLLSAHVQLSRAAIHEGRREETAALTAYSSALSFGRTAHAILEQAAAHRGIGDVLDRTGDAASAQAHWREALTLYSPLHLKEAAELRVRLGGTGT